MDATGAEVPVAVDPKEPAKAVVDWAAAANEPSRSPGGWTTGRRTQRGLAPRAVNAPAARCCRLRREQQRPMRPLVYAIRR
jgi:hypothetical protein